jgi:hypothetical protein
MEADFGQARGVANKEGEAFEKTIMLLLLQGI